MEIIEKFGKQLAKFIINFMENNTNLHLLEFTMNTDRIVITYYDDETHEIKTKNIESFNYWSD